MERREFREKLISELQRLFQDARSKDELSFLFTILGIDSGEEDSGWQPIAETQAFMHDIIGLINAPLNSHTKTRLGLLLYCHIIEASYLYHILYNLLLTAEGQPPKVFNFLGHYKNGSPPSAATKLSEIKSKAAELGYGGLAPVIKTIFRADIRNAFFHSDYILYDGKVRLKHRGSQIKEIDFSEIFDLIELTTDFFNCIMKAIEEARRSFPAGYRITGRKSKQGHNLCSVDVLIDEDGVATGFSCSDPLPIW